MYLLVINAGSSSLKFQLFTAKNLEKVCKGIIDSIGLPQCYFELETTRANTTEKRKITTHQAALSHAVKTLISNKIITSPKEITAIGHRVVHGGEEFYQPTKITPKVIKTIKKLSTLAPLHNPPNLSGILACEKIFPKTPQVAVFDTAFHHSIPEKAFLYGLPYSYYKKDKIRRYGFHGISHQYVTEQAKKILKKKNPKIISCHLGNGASIAASINGKCVDTSMGFTPLEGILMGTRSGDLDPAVVTFLITQKGLSASEVEKILNKESGLKGVSTLSSDMRVIHAKDKEKNPHAQRALSLFCYRITKYIGAYAAALNGLDALVFTATIGQKAWYVRKKVCTSLSHLGIELDHSKNRKEALEINKAHSKTKVLVIPTNEELKIAEEIKKVLKKK